MSAKPTPLGGSKPLTAGGALGLPFSNAIGYVATYPTNGTFSFRPPRAGFWKFIGWGAGGGNHVCGSGAYFEVTEYLDPAKTVAIVVGQGLQNSGGATTVTLPSGRVATANGGDTNNVVLATATGGDVNLSGSVAGAAGGGTGGGAAGTGGAGGGGAPANLPFRGGDGGIVGADGKAPGGGAGKDLGAGAHGQVIVMFDRP